MLASIEVRPTFIEEIKAKQFEDESLNELKKKTVSLARHKMLLLMPVVCSILREGFVFPGLMT